MEREIERVIEQLPAVLILYSITPSVRVLRLQSIGVSTGPGEIFAGTRRDRPSAPVSPSPRKRDYVESGNRSTVKIIIIIIINDINHKKYNT